MMVSRVTLSVLLLAVAANGHLEICIDDSVATANSSVRVYPLTNTSFSPLYFGLMVAPSEDNDYLNSTVSAVQLAMDTINADPDLLRGYSLHYTLTTSQCTESEIADATISQLFRTPKNCKLGLIEAGCTDGEASLVRTHWVNNFNIPQITCSPTIQDFTDDQNKVFEVSPANDVIVPALIELITHYNWTKLALITENKREYSQILKVLGNLESLNVTLNVSTLTVENHTLNVEGNCGDGLFDLNVRIILLLMSSETANHLLCEAFMFNIEYPKYEFIFVSDHHSDWWVGSPQDDSRYGCSTEQRAQVLNHSLALQWRPRYHHHKLELENNSLWNWKIHDRRALYCYDAVWTFALALNKTLTAVNNLSCVYEDRLTALQIQESIREISFEGLTGNVSFKESGSRRIHRTEVLIDQYLTDSGPNGNGTHLKKVLMGTYEDGNLSVSKSTTLWPRGVPYDGSPVYELVTVSVPLVVVYYSLATLGIAFAIACCAFNFAFRKTQIIRLTSPNLNYILIVGVIFFYISVFWYMFPSTNSNVVLAVCCLQPWFLGVGYFLFFGTIVAKLWRVYYVFRNPDSVKKKNFTDYHLMVFILLLSAAMATVLAIYIIVETASPGYELSTIPNDEKPSDFVGDREVDTRYEFYTCSRVPNARTAFTTIVFGTLGLMLVFALFMAFKTRKVQISGLSDAKYITAIVYITSLGSIVYIILNFTLRTRVNTLPALLSGSTMLAVTVNLGIIFIPKMISVYRDPDGEHTFSVDKDTNFQATQLNTVVGDHTSCTGCQDRQAKLKDLRERMSVQNKAKGKTTTSECSKNRGCQEENNVKPHQL